MRIATWNVNSVKARLPHLLKWMAEVSPDVVLLQELKCVTEAFPAEPIEDMGYNIAALGQKTYNGVAILSKYPIEDVVYGLPTLQEEAPQARYIEALVGTTRVASVYVPNGQEVGSAKFDYKMAFFKALQDHIQTLLGYGESLVVGGDYNVAPYAFDMHDPELSGQDRILCSAQEQAALRTLLHGGVYDALRVRYPAHTSQGEGLFSWWDYRAGSFERNKGFRIDHLLLSPAAVDLLEDAGVDSAPREWERPSDHAPVWCVLKGSS